jgi:hypothetical protein
VDWANAYKLTVTVAYPPEWGNSPQLGEGKCGDTRKGYEFGVEFTPLSGLGFEKWLAFKTADYAGLDKNVSCSEVEVSSLNGKGVTITESTSDTGARTAKVTINITEPVTLVPWCNPRPRLTQQTNPPLNPILTPFPFNQTVNIWFNMNIKPGTVVLGETVNITGIYASSVGNNGRGQPFKGDGGLSSYFTLAFPAANRVTLTPVEETAMELALLSISITVGPGVQNTNGVTMAQAETISYQTDSKEAQKAYRAEYITASRNGASWFGDTADYPWNSPSIDRRFNKSDKNTVHIRFSAAPPEGAPSVPNKIKIVEKLSYDLRGFNTAGQSCEEEYSGVTPSGGVYTITHNLQTAGSGIIQILVLPWYDDADAPIVPLQVNEAAAEGQYVTVVMDLSAPDVNNLNAKLNAPSSTEIRDNKTIHVYGSGAGITLTVDGLENLADNGVQGGISTAQAWGLPWTMDETNNLYWYVRIGEENQLEKKTSDRLNVYNGLTLNKTWSPAVITNLTDPGGYRVYVKFEDGMGNISFDWKDTGLIVKYSTAIITPVGGLQAVCNAAGNSINVSWTTPGGMTGAYVYVNGVENVINGEGSKNHRFTVPVINKSNVRDGQAVSNVTRYDISVVAYNAAGKAAARTLSVWNIEDMFVDQSNTVIFDDSMSSEQLAMSNGKNFVLTQDVTLSNWNPSAMGNFTGKFYGNGNTVSIGGFNVLNNVNADIGLFGVVDNGYIRDLTVQYSGSVSRSGETRFGGIAGTMSGTATMENVLVKGDVSVTVNTDHNMEVGSIAGKMIGTASIQNAYGGLNITVNHPYANTAFDKGSSVYIGGITGSMGIYVTGNAVKVEKVTVVGNFNVTANTVFSQGAGDNHGLIVGGLVGQIFNAVLTDSNYRQGNITVNSNYGDISVGGAIGFIGNSEITNCFTIARTFEIKTGLCQFVEIGGFAGQILFGGKVHNCYSENSMAIDTTSSTDEVCIGGFIGLCFSDISYCYSKGNLSVQNSSSSMIGGFAGWCNLNKFNCCYAAGNVSLLQSSNGHLSVGGFIASGRVYSLSNCYFMGNMFISDSTDEPFIYVGGLVGNCVVYDSGFIAHNFSISSVTILQSNSMGDTYAGGLSSALYSYFQNNVVLGASITVTGSDTINIGRIAGSVTSSSSNYAYSDMTLSTRTAYNAPWTPVTPSVGAATKDGADANDINLRTPAFWKGLGFLEEDWIFSTTVEMRHPILRASKNGPEMGGQR